VTPINDSKATPSTGDAPAQVTYTGEDIAKPVIHDTSITDKDGKPKQLVEGTDYDVTYYAASDIDPKTGLPKAGAKPIDNPTDAGDYAMVITYKGDYDGTYVTMISIAKAKLAVTTPSATKAYDGKPLTESKDATLTGFVRSETATLKVTGSQTEVGESVNTYEIAWDGTAKEANYEVASEDLGTLKVTEEKAAPAKPEPSKSSSSSSKSKTSSTAAKTGTSQSSTPKTGDDLPWQPFAAGAGMSILAILAVGWRLRRREDGRRSKPRA